MGELDGRFSHVWIGLWHEYILSQLADYAYNHIDFQQGTTKLHFIDLDDPNKRAALVPKDANARQSCIQLILKRKRRIDLIFARNPIGKLTKPKLEALLNDDGIVDALIRMPISDDVVRKAKLARVWVLVADRIARDIYLKQIGGEAEPEWLLWNRLLLSRFFHGSCLPSAHSTEQQMKTFGQGIHGPRSHLLAITELINECGVAETRMNAVHGSFKTGITLRCSAFSDLLGAIEHETQALPAGKGIVHRYGDANSPGAIPSALAHLLSQSQLISFRREFFQQHESNFLAYAVLSGIEQLLRSIAEKSGIEHVKDGVPKTVTRWINQLPLHEDLLTRLKRLYSPDGANLRNRAMHAALFEIESRRVEILIAHACGAKTSRAARSSYISKNLLQVFLKDLKDLDTFAASIGLNSSDLSWAQALWLTEAEIAFGRNISCDFIDPVDGDEWQRQFRTLFSKSLPSFAVPARIAVIGWQKGFETHTSLISFLIWGALFEALFRHTVHMIGIAVIQSGPKGNSEWKFQYQTLDFGENRLCSPEVLRRVSSVLRIEDRDVAEQNSPRD
jgi:hypothetical protein